MYIEKVFHLLSIDVVGTTDALSFTLPVQITKSRRSQLAQRIHQFGEEYWGLRANIRGATDLPEGVNSQTLVSLCCVYIISMLK